MSLQEVVVIQNQAKLNNTNVQPEPIPTFDNSWNLVFQAFNLLVIALAALSIQAKITVKYVNSEAEVPKHNLEGIFWNSQHPTWDKDGLLNDAWECTNDYGYGYSTLDKAKVKGDGKEDDASYIAIDAAKVPTLKISRKLTTEELSSYPGRCVTTLPVPGFSIPLDTLAQIGFTAYFLNEDDFFPSYAYTLYKQPKAAYVTGRDNTFNFNSYDIDGVNGIRYRYKQDLNMNCQRGSIDTFVYASLYNYGVVSDECVPNDFSKIKGWDASLPTSTGQQYYWDLLNGSSPIQEDTCSAGFKAYYKKYSFGTIVNGNLTTLKRAILRFGPVRVTGYYLRSDSTVEGGSHPGFANYGYIGGLIVGWNETALIEIDDFRDQDFKQAGKDIGVGKPLKITVGEGAEGVTYDIPFFETIQVFGSGVSVVRAALGLIAAVLVLPALLL
ncbi:MAG: hypothetical protein EZS28_003792 [Streblomastix strix]|uniref:Uncharacterized protein n=2 Tax=Streblomastix strix TaxID=222440 RepID=A0A5J4X0H3_9EUKA|nr:MAG: hypothetical protein EZS28_003792 [Streblomastix strix]